ncbi:MAG TPA: YdcF family protein [Candidatus Baltobacteraceae bacterium]|nr:YdcF family protein [Candidatus Baltobacteraceae bacterium]
MLVRERAQVQEVPRTLTGSLARLGLAVVVGTVGVTGYAAFRIWQQGQVDEGDRPADAIVVLGAAQYDGVPSPVFRARLDHALALFRRGSVRYLVVTGGRAPGDRFTEAQAARAYAVAHGVPDDRILDESTGRDTLESLTNVAALFRENDLSSAIFVSDRTHMLRVLRMAADLGITAYGSPATDSPTDADPSSIADAMVHELGGLAVYFFSH